MSEQNRELSQKPDKFVVMPRAEEMKEKLRAIGIYGVTPQADTFFDNFIGQIAESEKVGAGLYTAWELAQYDTLRDYPVQIRVVLNIGFERIIDTITPDPEVATQAKEFRQQVMDRASRDNS